MKKITALLISSFFIFAIQAQQPIRKNTTTNLDLARAPLQATYIKMNLLLPFATQEAEYFVKKDGHYFILNDDIIVGNDFPTTKSYSTNNKNYKWYNAQIPIVIDKSIFDNNMQSMVVSALNEMNTKLELSMIDRTTQQDYVRIQFSSTIQGAGQSPVGRQGGEQILFLKGTADKATIWHELLHAAGMWHEQSRNDRNNFVRIHTENLLNGTEHNFEFEPGNNHSNYDYCSIMHYPATAFSKNGQVTIECVSNNIAKACPSCMGQRNGFSPQDISGLDQFYNEVSRFPSNYIFVLSQQPSWRYCNKCHAMFYDGYELKGACPANGQHVASGYNFMLPHDVAATNNTQNSWRFCGKCFTMFYDGYPQKGVCAKGGGHTASGFNFVLQHDVAGTGNAQTAWRFCNKCYAMFYDGYQQKGFCAASGGHTASGFVFVLPHGN